MQTARTLLGVVSLASVAVAGITITPALIEGTDVPGVGLITTIDNLAINDSGQWIVEADTDNADTNIDGVLIRSGALYLREGDPLTVPAGTSIDSFDSITLNNAGNSGWNFFLADATTTTDSGIFFGDHLVIQESEFSTAPQLSPNTPYIGWFEVKINDSDTLLLMSSVDDPLIASTVDRALVVVTLDANDDVASEDVIAKEGDVLPGQSETVVDFLTGPHNFAFNNAGQAMFVADLTGDTALDHAIYVGSTAVAQEGQASPVAGRNWVGLSTSRVDLNDRGQYVHTGLLAGDVGSDTVIVASGGRVVKQEGDVFDGTSFTFASFGSGPVLITRQGRVLWYGDWNDADTTVDEGLFLDDQLLVQEGTTIINGAAVDTLRGVQDGYTISDGGRYILFEAILANGTDGAFQIEISYCPGEVAGDPQVDLNDLTAFLSAFGSCSGDSNYLYYADFDFDGCIGLSDLTVLLSEFGGSCL